MDGCGWKAREWKTFKFVLICDCLCSFYCYLNSVSYHDTKVKKSTLRTSSKVSSDSNQDTYRNVENSYAGEEYSCCVRTDLGKKMKRSCSLNLITSLSCHIWLPSTFFLPNTKQSNAKSSGCALLTNTITEYFYVLSLVIKLCKWFYCKVTVFAYCVYKFNHTFILILLGIYVYCIVYHSSSTGMRVLPFFSCMWDPCCFLTHHAEAVKDTVILVVELWDVIEPLWVWLMAGA